MDTTALDLAYDRLLEAVGTVGTGRRAGDRTQLSRRLRAQGRALSALAHQLSEDELDQPVPVLLLSGTTLLVDQPVSLRQLIAGLADDHLPRHTEQLLALLP